MYAFGPSVSANTIQQLMEYGRRSPGKIAYVSGGNGNINHLASQLFFYSLRIKALHVPYKGRTQAISDMIASQIHG